MGNFQTPKGPRARMTKPSERNQSSIRKERPADLHPVIRETYDAWLKSGMPLTEVAATINTNQGNLYRWLGGKGRPDLRVFDDLLNAIGFHYAIVDDTRRETAELREQGNQAPKSKNDIEPPPADAHQLVWEVFRAWQPAGIDLSTTGTIIGVFRGTLYRWFDNEGTPTPEGVEKLLNVVGKRLKVVRGTRPRSSSGAS